MIKIQKIEAPELDLYVRMKENQLRHYFEPDKAGAFIAESANVIYRALEAGYEPLSLLTEERYVDSEAHDLIERISRMAEAEGKEIPIFAAPLDVLSKMTGYHLTRGILAAFKRKTLLPVRNLCGNMSRIAVLEDVENPTNVGAIFRSAAALSMDAVLLTPGCADPLSRRSSRVSMGTVFQIPWTRFSDKAPSEIWPQAGMKLLQEMGFTRVSMALRSDTISIRDRSLREREKLAIILGNEGWGLSQSTISLSDYTVKIPMRNGVDSLNVAAASAVAFWELGKQAD